MKILVVGYGSIGRRHARLLAPLASELAVVSAQNIAEYRHFATLSDALGAFMPDYIVICTITSVHKNALNALKACNYRGKLLVEKPLFAHADEDAPPYPFSIHVAYQLRFNKIIAALKQALIGHKPLSAHIYVGQHLADWRPGRDPKTTYSASRAQGGGVLRDLSHEIDLIQYLFGPVEKMHAIGGKVGDVTIDSEDAVAMILKCKECPIISLQMNYLDRVPKREWIINTADLSIKADLVKKTLSLNNNISELSTESDDAYNAMHHALLHDQARGVCSYDEGLAVTKLIDTIQFFN